MSASPLHSILPDPVDSLPAEFRIEGLLGVRELLRDLMRRKVPVTLYADDGVDDFLVTRITHVDEREIEFDLAGQPGMAGPFERARAITGIAFPGRVKTQFRLGHFELSEDEARAAPVLRAAIPEEMWRIQRRDAFRVVPPEMDRARFLAREEASGECVFPLADLSAGGAALRMSPDAPAPRVGHYWPHGRIEAGEDRTIPCSLIVRHVGEASPDDRELRIGCEFQQLPPEVQRQIQLYVIDIDKRQRRGG